MTIVTRGAVILWAALTAAACSNSTSSTLPTPTPTIVTDTFTGIVQATVNGVFQSDSKPFTTSASGTVSVTLTSGVETLPGGTPLPNVVMGVGIGSFASNTCTLLTGGATTAQASSAIVLQGTLAAGSYCVQVFDVTNQTGPVAYTVLVSHPQ
jgi:hypothetical protein